MGIINVENMYHEMRNTMKNNFTGSPNKRYILAKRQYLETVGDIINQNKKELIKEIEEKE